MEHFDLLHTPLTGMNLIEAGAGTGKTYNIAGLYLRLLLEKQLTVDRILVVTFTKAATQELQERIRKKILAARKACLTGTCRDPIVGKLIARVASESDVLDRLQEALQEFDHAAIFTIHGLCQRLLIDHAFEMGGRFDTELVAEPAPLIASAANDFWRRSFYQAPPEMVRYVLNQNRSPVFFQALMEKAQHAGMRVIPDLDEPGLDHLSEFRNVWSRVRSMWPDARCEIEHLLADPGLNAKVYGSLKPHKPGPDQTVRQMRVSSLLRQMDRFVTEEEPELPLWKTFDKFTAAKVKSAAKKGQQPISHPFFEICQALQQSGDMLLNEMAARWIYLKRHSLEFSHARLHASKQQQNVQFFDDLLVIVRRALSETHGNLLASKIRQRYRAALVDEFQDTDQVQYEIFSRIFAGSTCPLFMIGDPKQAIYSFRGADVFSYFKAAEQAVHRYTLSANFRSSPGLIRAVNTLFSNVTRPLIFKEIPFVPGTAGKPLDPKAALGGGGLHIWHLACKTDQKMNVKAIGSRIARAVCTEIVSLAGDPNNDVRLGDMAVLVRTNRQAVQVKTALSDANIPAVVYSAGNVFETAEAEEFGRILMAVSEPAKIGTLKAALITDVLGWRFSDIDPQETSAAWWEKRIAHFRAYRQYWRRDGFMAMFRRMMTGEKVRERLLASTNGERRLTNLLHVSEILHAAASEQNLGMNGLLKWFFKQVHPETPKQAVHQLRLESDARAVKVVTIHKSKGLEFPVVFCPFSWGSTRVGTEDFIFHDLQTDGRVTLDLGSKEKEAHWVQARNEQLAENLRLLYVAVTRAARRCYLVWPMTRSAGGSALAYLIHGQAVANRTDSGNDIAADLQRHFSGLSPEAYLADLQKLAQRSRGSIILSSLPGRRAKLQAPAPSSPDKLRVKSFVRELDTSWRIASYSSLVSHAGPDHELPDRDAGMNFADESRESTRETGFGSESGRKAPALSSFPKGATSGLFFHEILENVDFSNPDQQIRRDMVGKRLAAYGFDAIWESPIVSMLGNLSAVMLSPRYAPFALSAVKPAARINEMAFYFPLKHITAGALSRVFADFSDRTIQGGFSQALDRLTFSPVEGLMKGFLDVFFEHRGRYYIVDWKSNFLGPALESYRQDRLHTQMVNAYYFLQYHLYVLAMHLHLKMRLPGYVYNERFGGVFYIFLRGISAERDPAYGIYEDRPDMALIEALEKALVPA